MSIAESFYNGNRDSPSVDSRALLSRKVNAIRRLNGLTHTLIPVTKFNNDKPRYVEAARVAAESLDKLPRQPSVTDNGEAQDLGVVGSSSSALEPSRRWIVAPNQPPPSSESPSA